MLKVFSLPILMSIVVTPLASCGYSGNILNYNPADTPSQTTDVNSRNNAIGTNESIDSNIISSKEVNNSLSLKEQNSNSYGLTQNYQDFEDNGDFSNFLGDEKLLIDDIIGYLNVLYFANNKSISITNASVNDLNVTDKNDQGKLIFNKSKISFNLTATISTSKITSSFNLLDKKYNLAANYSSTISISVKDQIILPVINNYNNRYYLGWKVNSASIKFQNETINKTDFNVTQNSFSKAFYVLFNNLSNKQTYFDLKNKYQSTISSDLTNDKVKNFVETKVNDQTSLYFDSLDISRELLDQIATNEPVNKIVQSATQYLLKLAFKSGIISNEFQSFLEQALAINSDGTISSKTLLEIICENKIELMKVLKKYLGTAYDLIEPMIVDLQPNMNASNNSYKIIVNYLSQFGISEELKNIITGDILGVTGTSKNLWQIIWDNFALITNKIKESNSSNTSLVTTIEILQIIFSSKDSKGNYPTLLDGLFAYNDTKTKFTNLVTKLLPTNISQYLKIIISDNNSFTKENFKKIIEVIDKVINGLFKYQDNVTSDTDYYKRYKNLSFTREWVTTPTISKSNNKITTNFNYQIKIKILSEVDIDLTPFKNLISQTVFNNLVQTIAGTSKEQLTNEISSAASASGVTLVTNASTMADNELDRTRQLLLKFIPDTIKLGSDENALTFTYSANNQEIWFNPSKKSDDYFLGYSIGYNLNIFYDDPGMINSIAKNFSKADVTELKDYQVKKLFLTFNAIHFKYTAKYYNFWQPIFENVLLKSYDIKSRFFVSDYSKKIANSSNYNPDYYYTNLTFTNNSSSLKKEDIQKIINTSNTSNIQEMNSNITLKNSSKNNVTWSNVNETIKGKNIVVTDENKQALFNKIYSINTSNSNYSSLGYNYDFNFSALLDLKFNLDLSLIVNTYAKLLGITVANSVVKTMYFKVLFDISSYNSSIYFPVKFYDTTNNKLASNYFKNYSFFNTSTNSSI